MVVFAKFVKFFIVIIHVQQEHGRSFVERKSIKTSSPRKVIHSHKSYPYENYCSHGRDTKVSRVIESPRKIANKLYVAKLIKIVHFS